VFKIFRSTKFKKDYKKLTLIEKNLLKIVVSKLARGEKLSEKYKDHKLIGNYLNYRECHIKPDLLLIYKIDNDVLKLSLSRISSHSQLFK
jgi:mRNA interferase YafQ